ncbi:MAG: hypothetical protein GDA48_03680 [Hormoscilla sp. GM102CHS1]|nr:hypothetical protein [Hormoscilla sp. GM102CHS1]
MNRTCSHSDIGKLFLTGLCVLLMVGGILGADRSALAAQLPPGEYDRIGTTVVGVELTIACQPSLSEPCLRLSSHPATG